MNPKPSERGAALLVVLLLVAVMSVMAVSVLEDIRFAIRRTTNMQALGQAQWYALGAEALAKSRLEAVLADNPGYVTLDGGWNAAPVVYPIQDGAISLRLSDRGACFNLNSVVSGEPNGYVANPTGVAQFRALLVALDVPEAEATGLADTLTDWIDSDSEPRPLGAENEAYLRRSPPYRASGVLLAEETELRAIQGFGPELYARLRPHVCALPFALPTTININTLSPTDAPVLSAVYTGRLDVGDARQIIGRRPAGGWPDQASFLQEPLLEAAVSAGGTPPIQQLELRSRFFSLDGSVEIAGATMPYSALLEAHPSGLLQTAARRWTAPE